MANITHAVAFLAGLVSFLSPCVLPIIPGFLAYLAGTSLADAKENRKDIFLNSLFFVLGFSVIFALLGVLLNTLLESFAYDVQIWLSRIGGAIIIFFGLYLTGLLKIPFLEKTHTIQVKKRFKSKYATSFLFGLAFAAGWTPCVGAALGAILGLAASQPGAAFGLLMAYALGLGMPFLVVGLFATRVQSFMARSAKYIHIINSLFGVILIVLGVLIFTQQLNIVANFELLNSIIQR
ncbi:MAG: cytochrome c biogenesis protein CcdA [Patescibacteria group bacterium]